MARGGGAFLCAPEGFAWMHRGFLKVRVCVCVGMERRQETKRFSPVEERWIFHIRRWWIPAFTLSKSALAALGHRTLAKPPLSLPSAGWFCLSINSLPSPAFSSTRIQIIVDTKPSQELVLGERLVWVSRPGGRMGGRGSTGLAEAASLKKSAEFWDSPAWTGALLAVN